MGFFVGFFVGFFDVRADFVRPFAVFAVVVFSSFSSQSVILLAQPPTFLATMTATTMMITPTAAVRYFQVLPANFCQELAWYPMKLSSCSPVATLVPQRLQTCLFAGMGKPQPGHAPAW
jgi:hypothetical protein